MNATHNAIKSLILAHLVTKGGTCTSQDARTTILALVGGDPTLIHDINAISNARSSLKQEGLVADGSVRGEWVITDAGRAVAGGAPWPKGVRAPAKNPRPAKVADGPEVVTEVVTEVADAPEPAVLSKAAEVTDEVTPVETTEVVADAAPTAAAPAAPKRRLKVADGPVPAVVVPEWLNDADVRGAVIENQDCFGAFSAKSAACGECALAGFCRNAKAAQLDLLARKLVAANPLVNTPLPAPVAKLDAAVGAVLDPNAARTAVNPTGGTIKATYDGVCAESGQPIKKGDNVRYVIGKGVVKAD